MRELDAIDLKIIEVLKANSRSSISDISKKVNLSIPAVAERIRKLEEARVIEGYTVKINREKMDYKILAFIFVDIERNEDVEYFREVIVQYRNVLECHHVAGEYDYLLKVLVEDTRTLDDFLSNTLKKIRGVTKSNTIITLSTLKEELNL